MTATKPVEFALVTVYITSHNYGRYLDRAIQSVLGQTMQDFELIIIDDGSTDDSRGIIEGYDEHPKVITIFQQNKGLNVTNNIALRMARGKYIMRLDADDWLDENALNVLAGALERDPDVGMVFPDYYLVDPEGAVQEVVRRHDFDEVSLLDQPAHGACTLIRADCLREIGGYDESFRCQDGYDLWIRFIQKFKVQNVNLPLFYYRQHECSLTANEQRILDTRRAIIEKSMRRNGRKLSTVAIVPIRGPGINPRSLALKPLAGKPLFEWTLDTALAAGRIDEVVVTTPDGEVAKRVGERYGDRIRLIERPRSLGAFNTPIEMTLEHALAQLPGERLPDAVALLIVESPFRRAEHIDSAIDVLELFQTDSVVGVRPETGVIYRHTGDGLNTVRQSQSLRLEQEELLREAGGLRILTREHFESRGKVTGGRIGHVIIDEDASHNVGHGPWHWEVAEMLARRILAKREG